MNNKIKAIIDAFFCLWWTTKLFGFGTPWTTKFDCVLALIGFATFFLFEFIGDILEDDEDE